MNAPAVIVDGSQEVTADFTIGDVTEGQSVAIWDTGSALVVRSLDGEVTIPYDMITEVAGAMLAVVLA